MRSLAIFLATSAFLINAQAQSAFPKSAEPSKSGQPPKSGIQVPKISPNPLPPPPPMYLATPDAKMSESTKLLCDQYRRENDKAHPLCN